MKQTSKIHTEGADIVFDREGQGPLLLLIAGGNGDGTRYGGISRLLADQYTVISYDRRAEGRSGGDRAVDLDMAQQGRDAAALIRAAGAETALVFGNSAGANIGLKLAEDHPQMVRGLVAHEPPVMQILPDAESATRIVDEVYGIYLARGAGPAMARFAQSLVGFDRVGPAPGDQGRDFEHFMAHSYVNISRYVPDLEALRRSGVNLVTAVGLRSADAYYARTARFIAHALGCPCVEMSGNHLAYVIDPPVFAAELRPVLAAFSPAAS